MILADGENQRSIVAAAKTSAQGDANTRILPVGNVRWHVKISEKLVLCCLFSSKTVYRVVAEGLTQKVYGRLREYRDLLTARDSRNLGKGCLGALVRQRALLQDLLSSG